MTIEKFAAFVVEKRKEKGYTQSELAKKLYVTNKAISKWERGLNYPDITTIELLAKELGVTVIELLSGERKMDENKNEEIKINEAVSKTLDFSKQLIRNQKKNYLNQGLILIIVFLLVLVGYQGYNQMFGSFGVSVFDLNKKITDLQTQIDQLQVKSEELNVFGNGIYYCYSPEGTFESIEFVSADVIRVYAYAVPDIFKAASNNYFSLEKIGKNQFTITGDVIRDDTYGTVDYKNVTSSWGSIGLFKVIEITEDHKTLYYGIEHTIFFCTLNSRPQ